MKRTPLRKISKKQKTKNAVWHKVVEERAIKLINKYGYLICEYSGERIAGLTAYDPDLNDGWGHHIDGNRNNNTIGNCYICKYKYHTIITDNNIQVSQEDFVNRKYFM